MNIKVELHEKKTGRAEKRGDTSLFMGRSLYNRENIFIPGSTGMVTVGGARGGKGRSSSIPNLLLWPHSAWVIDVKGTHAAVTARYRREVLGQDVYIVDPFNVLGNGTDGFDPLDIDVTAPDIREQIGVRADAIVVPGKSSDQEHWDDGARTIGGGVLGQLITPGKFESPTLPMIRDLLTQMPEEQRELWLDMAMNDQVGGVARDAAARVIRGIETNEILGLLSNLDKHTEWLASAPIANVFSKRSFTFAQLKKKPTTIYLVIPPHYLDQHKRFLRLFINLAINEMSIGGRSPIPVLGLIDEYLSCGFMAETLKAFSLLQGYNLMLWPFIQDLKSARDLYGARFDAVINNCRAVQMFAISDEESTRFASERIGPRSMRYVWGAGAFGGAAPMLRNPTEAAQEVYADGGLQYILRAGLSPMLLKKVIYYEDQIDPLAKFMPDWMKAQVYPLWNKYDPDPDYQQ
jgi:type IV secretion system protein VirD4